MKLNSRHFKMFQQYIYWNFESMSCSSLFASLEDEKNDKDYVGDFEIVG